jgi:hypothetical protein
MQQPTTSDIGTNISLVALDAVWGLNLSKVFNRTRVNIQ